MLGESFFRIRNANKNPLTGNDAESVNYKLLKIAAFPDYIKTLAG